MLLIKGMLLEHYCPLNEILKRNIYLCFQIYITYRDKAFLKIFTEAMSSTVQYHQGEAFSHPFITSQSLTTDTDKSYQLIVIPYLVTHSMELQCCR